MMKVISVKSALDIVRRTLPFHEGVKDRIYADSQGVPTIGVGRNLRDVGLSAEEIRFIFENDLRRIRQELDVFFPWWRDHDPVRQAVLLELEFNLGATRLRRFKDTLRAFQAGEYVLASQHLQDSIWYQQVKIRSKHLVYMLATGKLPADLEAGQADSQLIKDATAYRPAPPTPPSSPVSYDSDNPW